MSLSQSNAELSRTIRAIEAPAEASRSPQEPSERGEEGGDTPAPAEGPRTAPSEARPAWWRRWLRPGE
jgi:hypothetical protein